MNTQKALEVLQLAKQYGCKLELAPPDKIRYSSQQRPPEHLLEEIKLHKPVLLEYLKHTSRDLSVLVKRAFDGYDYCLKQVQKQARRDGVPLSFARVPVMFWRSTVKTVLLVNDAEMGIIERLLIQDGQLKYLDRAETILTTDEQEQQEYMPDDATGTAFNNWLYMPQEFIYC